MIEGEDFILGLDNTHRNANLQLTYNPDKSHNFHLSLSGSSGSGKTRMLKHLIKYLMKKQKHIHVIDVKGDLHIDGENYIDFPIRNQTYGINPFEFDKNVLTGGIKRRSHEIVEMITKSFQLKIGASKKDVINKLILDTYKLKGITEDESTWGIELNKEEQAQMLPGIEDLLNLTHTILDAINYGQSEKLDKIMVKHSKKAIKSSSKIKKMVEVLEKIKKPLVDKYYFEANEQFIKQEEHNIEFFIDNLIKNDPEYKKIVDIEKDIMLEKKIIEEVKQEFLESAENIFENFIGNENKSQNNNYSSFVSNDDMLKNIDLKYYSKKTVMQMLESVSVYFEMLVGSGLFNKTVPPVKAGLNRYDISKHNQETQIFFTEVIAFKLFNATKLRGDYSKKSSQYKEKRGVKNDTFLVIDEAQVVLPDTNTKEKESSAQIINRIAAESRSYGLGVVLSSQSLTRFSNIVNINVPNKIIFKTLGTDIQATKKIINLNDPKDKIFNTVNSNFGMGLYIDETQKKSIFITPWYNDEKKLVKLS